MNENELSANQLYRIPTHDDYDMTASILDNEAAYNGGLWRWYNHEAVNLLHTDPGVRQYMKSLSSLAELIEPYEEKREVSRDQLFRATHAFRAGLWTSRHVIDIVHRGHVTYEQAHGAAVKALPFPSWNGREQREANREKLFDVGEEGLIVLGAQAKDAFRKWATKMIDYEPVRNEYVLGTSVGVFAAHALYTIGHKKRMDEEDLIARLNTDEIEQYINTSDSSDN